jgi:Na+-driven multidrug efflux pump
MIAQGTGAIINIILDPILIHGWFGLPALGVAGAAIATVVGQWGGAILAAIFNLKFNPDVHLGLKYLKLRRITLGPVFAVSIPATVMLGIGSLMNFGMNQILQGFTETATGVFGIYYKLQSFFFMPVIGMNNAVISIVAFNYGARRPDRMVKTLKIALCGAMGLMVAGLLAFQLVPELLLGMFNPTEEFLLLGCSALRIISIHFPIAALCIILGATFQAMGNGIYSSITSLCRQLVVLLPAAYLLSLTGEVNNVWWAFPIAEVASALVTVFLFLRIYRNKIKPMM